VSFVRMREYSLGAAGKGKKILWSAQIPIGQRMISRATRLLLFYLSTDQQQNRINEKKLIHIHKKLHQLLLFTCHDG